MQAVYFLKNFWKTGNPLEGGGSNITIGDGDLTPDFPIEKAKKYLNKTLSW